MYYYRVGQNVRCAVEDLHPTGDRAVLFVHGWPLSKEIFEYQYNVLPKHNIRCISYDLRGFGQSDKPFGCYTYNTFADDLYKIIQSIPCSDITLLGFSMGGAICTRYMARYRGFKVKRLVLCGAAAPHYPREEDNPNGMTIEQIDALMQSFCQDRPCACDSFGRMCFASKPTESFLQWFSGLAWEAAGYATVESLISLRDEDLHEDLRKICVPTAIFHGRQDRICPFELAEAQHSAIAQSYIVPFENSGHCSFYDEKEKFNQELLDFISDC
ncbi:MAG: alpha/beta hydrolase [Clostridiales bacterium]|nr:alpha/beta hydrolase [Clostridiales bacterium]